MDKTVLNHYLWVFMLRITLFGSPQLILHDQSITDELNGQPLALLAYLAVTHQPQSRSQLANLFWNDMPEEKALKNLRAVLSRLNTFLKPYLLIAQTSLAWNSKSNYWLDVDVLRSYLNGVPNRAAYRSDSTHHASDFSPAALETSLSLYQDNFLSGLTIRNAPSFEEWVTQKRQELHQLSLQALQSLSNHYEEQGEFAGALRTTQQILQLEPWREEVHRQKMLLLAKQGERTAALMQFTICKEVLAKEFQIEPSAETLALYQQIRNGLFGTGAISKEQTSIKLANPSLIPATDSSPPCPPTPLSLPASSPAQRAWNNLPDTLKFYGRKRELALLTQWIGNPTNRLIGIFGMAGVGKSALIHHWLRQGQQTTTEFQQIFLFSPQMDLGTMPEFADWLQNWLEELMGEAFLHFPVTLDGQLKLLLNLARQQRLLLIFDQVERILQAAAMPDTTDPNLSERADAAVDSPRSATRKTAQAYVTMFRWFALQEHASCLALISRERPMEFARWEESLLAVRSMHLEGLDVEASQQLLEAYGVKAQGGHPQPHSLQPLIQRYAGHPLALVVAAETIQECFAGDWLRFQSLCTWVFDELYQRLSEQFTRLTEREQSILFWLTLEQAACSVEELWLHIAGITTHRLFLDGCRSLMRYGLLEPIGTAWTLPSVLREFTTLLLLEAFYREVTSQPTQLLLSSAWLNRYRLYNPQGSTTQQQAQTNNLITPLLQQLTAHFGPVNLINHLLALQEMGKSQPPLRPGYLTANLQHLLESLSKTSEKLAHTQALENNQQANTLLIDPLVISSAFPAVLPTLEPSIAQINANLS